MKFFDLAYDDRENSLLQSPVTDLAFRFCVSTLNTPKSCKLNVASIDINGELFIFWSQYYLKFVIKIVVNFFSSEKQKEN
jgi:hypothetical protein